MARDEKGRKPVTRERCMDYLIALRAAVKAQGPKFNQAKFIQGMGMGQHFAQAVREAHIMGRVRGESGKMVYILDSLRDIEQQATDLWVAYKVGAHRHNRAGKVHREVENDIDKQNKKYFEDIAKQGRPGIGAVLDSLPPKTEELEDAADEEVADNIPESEEIQPVADTEEVLPCVATDRDILISAHHLILGLTANIDKIDSALIVLIDNFSLRLDALEKKIDKLGRRV